MFYGSLERYFHEEFNAKVSFTTKGPVNPYCSISLVTENEVQCSSTTVRHLYWSQRRGFYFLQFIDMKPFWNGLQMRNQMHNHMVLSDNPLIWNLVIYRWYSQGSLQLCSIGLYMCKLQMHIIMSQERSFLACYRKAGPLCQLNNQVFR